MIAAALARVMLLLVTILMLAAPPRDAQPVVADGTATVSGVVVSADPQPRPLRRARVTLTGQMFGGGRTTMTADDGSFAFDRVPAGRFTLAATKDGYVALGYGAARTVLRGTGVDVAEGQAVRASIRLPHGAVITGRVVDVDGLPAQGFEVTALAHRYVGWQGEIGYLGAGMPAPALSDDRGVYRIFGLPAGDYVVAAKPQERDGSADAEVRTVARGVVSDKRQVMTQAFHPGATEVGRASRVTLRAGEERSGINIQLQYVALARISGMVPAPAGWNAASLTMVRTDEQPGFAGVRKTDADAGGRFTISGVPPGQYRLTAVSTAASPVTTPGSPLLMTGDLLTASAEINVHGEDVERVSLSLQPALTVSGRVAFEGHRAAPDLEGLRVPEGLHVPAPMISPDLDTGQAFPSFDLERDGTFKVSGIVPGLYRMSDDIPGLRAPIRAWWLKSLVVNGRDMLDAPLDLRQGTDDAVVTFSDRASEIRGTLKDAQGAPAPEACVVVFGTDRSTWFYRSRRVAGVHPGLDGRFSIRNLPPGEYRVAAVLDIEQNAWFDPAVLERLLPAAAALTVTGVEAQTRDLVIR